MQSLRLKIRKKIHFKQTFFDLICWLWKPHFLDESRGSISESPVSFTWVHLKIRDPWKFRKMLYLCKKLRGFRTPPILRHNPRGGLMWLTWKLTWTRCLACTKASRVHFQRAPLRIGECIFKLTILRPIGFQPKSIHPKQFWVVGECLLKWTFRGTSKLGRLGPNSLDTKNKNIAKAGWIEKTVKTLVFL